MKDSGIEWIGKIPKEWKLVKMSNVCSIITDYVASGSFASLAENVEYIDEPDYAMLVRTMDISKKGYSGKPVYINQHAYEFLSNSNLFGGEIVLPNIGASVGDVYIVPKLYERMSLAPNSIMIRTIESDKFVYYYFLCSAGRLSVINIAQSTAQPKFNKTDFRQIRIALPPLPEQQKITDYLDNQCSKIDEITAKIKITIDEYKKLKQSVITEAVTKGIRLDREMKDSGIEWIGEIPKEWNIVKMKYLGKCRNGLTYSPDNIVAENGTLVLRSSNIKNGQLDFTDNVFVNCKIKPEFMVKNGDILICSRNGSRNLIGKNAIISKNLNASFGAFMMIFRCESSKYVQMILSSSLFSYYLGTFLTSTINQLTAENFNNMKIVYCDDIKEQQEIVNYLDKKCAEIDALIAKKEQIVTELESYKKSLIYEYVTGKKEVI